MKVELGEGLSVEEKPEGFVTLRAEQACEVTLSREEFARRMQAACNEALDPA